ncbi:hypothetical protein AAC387_Pa05g0384 [Persea americana]
MGKYMRKSKMAGEVAVMEVVSQSSLGVRTRAKTLALQKSNTSSASYLQLRSRRLQKPLSFSVTDSKKKREVSGENPNDKTNKRLVSVSENPVSVSKKDEAVEAAVEADRNSVNAEGLPEASCGENIPDIDERERNIRETTPCSLIGDSEILITPGSTTRPTNSIATNRRIQNPMHQDIPTAHEMEEFFASAEQEQQRIFIEKYNYDPVNDLPLAGRYEWLRLDQ